jgi:hypothetical protein
MKNPDVEILTSVLTIQSSISQFEFLFEQLSTIKLFQCFHIQMVVVPFLRNDPSAVMFFQRFIGAISFSGVKNK